MMGYRELENTIIYKSTGCGLSNSVLKNNNNPDNAKKAR
jgi:hypothetical protein